MKRILQLTCFVCLFGLISISSVVQSQRTQPSICARFQERAFDEFSAACAGTEDGEFCYGYNAIVGFEDETTEIDDLDVGDKLPLTEIEAVISEPYATTNDMWGLSLMMLPDVEVSAAVTEPNLRYILFGGVELTDTDEPDNDYEHMQSFTFATNQDDLCVDAPSTVFIQTHCDYDERQFRAEGIDFTLDGGVLLLGGGDTGYIQVIVVYGVLVIEPDVYTDGIAEPTDQTEPIVVPVGYTTTAPLDADEPIDSEDHVGPWSPIRQLSRQELVDLVYLQNIPQNFGYCPIDIPSIRQASGAGGTITRLRFTSAAPLEPVTPFCQVPNPPAFCTYLDLP